MKHLLLSLFLLLTWAAFAQDDKLPPLNPPPAPDDVEVEVTGMGVSRTDALNDALRAAVGKAAGVTVKSETQVENFMVVSDAIATNSQGYITGYAITTEGQAPIGYQVSVKAKVSQKPLKADINLLAQAVGGIRWLVAYDARGLSEAQRATYEQAVDRANQYLAEKRYRYIERSRLEQLQKQASNMLQADKAQDSAGLSYAQQLGVEAGAQFIIMLGGLTETSRSEAFDTRTSTRVAVQAKAYDNCTGEGLATVPFDGDWQSGREATAASRSGIDAAVAAGMPKVMESVLAYIGDWANNGVPFELRFYGLGGYRDLRELRQKLTQDPLYGGQLELTSVEGYTRLNGTFKRRPEQMADRVLDLADQVPAIAARRLDVRFMFGRQINFAPTGTSVPSLDALAGGGGQPTVRRPPPPAIRPGNPALGGKATPPRKKPGRKK